MLVRIPVIRDVPMIVNYNFSSINGSFQKHVQLSKQTKSTRYTTIKACSHFDKRNTFTGLQVLSVNRAGQQQYTKEQNDWLEVRPAQ